MKKIIRGAIALARLSATFPNSLILTLVGILASGGFFGLRALVLFLANWLTPIFACAINDVEDADDDAKDSKKVIRNPICNGSLTQKQGYLISFTYGFLAIGLYLLLGLWVHNYQVILFGVTGVIVAFFYSWKPVRFKSIPIIDLFSHGYMLAAAQFAAAYLAFSPNFNSIGLSLLIASYLISIQGDFENENRDFKVDRETKISNTAQLIGKYKISRVVQYIIMAGFVGTMLYVFFNITIDLNLIWLSIACSVIVFIFLYSLKALKLFKETFIEILNASVQLGVLITIAIYIILR